MDTKHCKDERHFQPPNSMMKSFYCFKIITNTMTLMDYPLFQGNRTEHVGEWEGYSKRLHSMPEAACTGKNELLMMSFPKARNM